MDLTYTTWSQVPQYVIQPLAEQQIHEQHYKWLMSEATERHGVMCLITDNNAQKVSIISKIQHFLKSTFTISYMHLNIFRIHTWNFCCCLFSPVYSFMMITSIYTITHRLLYISELQATGKGDSQFILTKNQTTREFSNEEDASSLFL